MRRWVLILVMVVGLVAGEYEQGVQAYNNHNYSKALQIFKKLADQGDVR